MFLFLMSYKYLAVLTLFLSIKRNLIVKQVINTHFSPPLLISTVINIIIIIINNKENGIPILRPFLTWLGGNVSLESRILKFQFRIEPGYLLMWNHFILFKEKNKLDSSLSIGYVTRIMNFQKILICSKLIFYHDNSKNSDMLFFSKRNSLLA